MKTCPKCHNEFEDLYAFCIKDGTPLENLVAETDSEIEQVTVLRPQNDPPPIPPPIGEETVIMDNADIPQIGEETAVMSEADFAQVGNNDEYEEVEEFEEYRQTPDLDQTAVPTEEWNEESVQDETHYSAAQIPIVQDAVPDAPKPVQEEKSNSKLGLILGGVGLLCLLLLGTVAAGVYLYTQSGSSSTEIASTKEGNTNLETDDTAKDADLDSSNVNSDENLENSNAEDGSLSNLNDNKQDKTDKDKDKDKKKDKNDKKKTPNPTPKNTSTDEKITPTPEKSPKLDIRNPTPRTKTPTPRPTRNRITTPTPRPTRSNIPKRIARGVVNGKATSLPKPAYPSAARSNNIKGSVNVAVIISKTGRVLSARAVSGHPLLKQAAVSAARRARFSPTMLSGRAVEVSGVIVYNFQ